jgi:hypothetical protein
MVFLAVTGFEPEVLNLATKIYIQHRWLKLSMKNTQYSTALGGKVLF